MREIVEWLRTQNWAEPEIEAIYEAVRSKMRGKTCHICDKWAPIYGGELYWPDGDMSKPKKFRCQDCIEALR